MQPVKFKNGYFEMAGNLYFPDGMNKSKKYPAIVLVHPIGGVKEQVVGLYADKLSKYGYVTLAFDASHQGESGGEPHFLEDPAARVEDVRCAVDFITTLSYVDTERIGGLGICAGASYVLSASQTEHRIKALATVSFSDHSMMRGDSRSREQSEIMARKYNNLDNTTPILVANIGLLQAVGKQRSAEANGAEPMYVNYVPNSPAEFTDHTPDMLKEAYEYYRTPRGQHPNSKNIFLFSSIDKMLGFSAFDRLGLLLTQPTMFIAGTKADTRYFSEDAYAIKNGPKELVLVDGATHVGMYDIPQYVSQAIESLTRFFQQSL
jgi:fermentation-respiration switch protein FrsA (DUF1100 family)